MRALALLRNGLPVCNEALNVALDRLFCHCEGFFKSFPLRNDAGQAGNCDRVAALVRIGVEDDSESVFAWAHGASQLEEFPQILRGEAGLFERGR